MPDAKKNNYVTGLYFILHYVERLVSKTESGCAASLTAKLLLIVTASVFTLGTQNTRKEMIAWGCTKTKT